MQSFLGEAQWEFLDLDIPEENKVGVKNMRAMHIVAIC